jgi:hypothetical protein
MTHATASVRERSIAPSASSAIWMVQAVTIATGLGMQVIGLYATWATFGTWKTLALYALGGLTVLLHRMTAERRTVS